MTPRQKYGPMAVAASFLCLGLWVLWQTHTTFASAGVATPDDPMSNSALFPNWIAYLMVAFSAWTLVLEWTDKRPLKERCDDDIPDGSDPDIGRRRWQGLGICVLVFIYLLVLEPIGFHLATPLLMICALRLLGGPMLQCLVLGLLSSVVVGLLFEKALEVELPVGILGGFF